VPRDVVDFLIRNRATLAKSRLETEMRIRNFNSTRHDTLGRQIYLLLDQRQGPAAVADQLRDRLFLSGRSTPKPDEARARDDAARELMDMNNQLEIPRAEQAALTVLQSGKRVEQMLSFLRSAMSGKTKIRFIDAPSVAGKTLDQARLDVIQLKQDGDELDNLPVARAEVEKLCAAFLDQVGGYSIANMFEHDGLDRYAPQMPSTAFADAGQPDSERVLRYYARKAIEADFKAQMDKFARPNG